MAFSRLVFTLLVISVIQCYASVEVPVFLWGDLAITSGKANPLQSTTEEGFKDLLSRELTNEPFTVIFLEETLSVEDFSRKDSDGKTSFKYLQANLGDSYYLPSVQNPLIALKQFANPDDVNHVKFTENGLSAEIEPQGGKFLIISLKDAREGESRTDLLRRHNDFMERKFAELQAKNPSLIAIYTAHYPSWSNTESHSRARRQAAELLPPHDYVLDRLRLYVEKILLIENSDVVDLQTLTANNTVINGTILNTTLTFGDTSITLNFLNQQGYWKLDTIGLQKAGISETLYPELDIYSLNSWCYRCAENVTFTTQVNDTNKFTLKLDNLKIQPFFYNETEYVFGDSFNCVGFFSVAIWAGLFVVFILLSIMFFGIVMMMDIKTMDRFDDPKGKTITINAVE